MYRVLWHENGGPNPSFGIHSAVRPFFFLHYSLFFCCCCYCCRCCLKITWNGQKNLYTLYSICVCHYLFIPHSLFLHNFQLFICVRIYCVVCMYMYFVCSSIAKRCNKCLCESLHREIWPEFCMYVVKWDVKFAMHKTKILRQ